MIKRSLAVLLSTLILAPTGVFAQQSRAGIVTTLEGNVSARRVALPSPVPLKFKDDILLQDTVTTGDKSLARMLLGGKAVVTVRERSVITITEVPGKSTIDLETGKFALAVAREKMRPGEEIQIRTPNAVAAVRGTVVITEVNRQSAQVGGGAPAVLTSFYVLRGSITAQVLDPGTRQGVGVPVSVGANQKYQGAGLATPTTSTMTAGESTQAQSGLKPSGVKDGGDTGKEQVKAQQVQTAVTLLTTLTGGTQQAGILAPPPTVTPTTTTADGSSPPPILAFEASEADLTNIALNSARSFGSSFSSGSTASLIQVTNATLSHAGHFVDVLNGAAVSLAGPLATFVNSTLDVTGALLSIVGGSLTSTTQSALFSLDPTTITTGDALIVLDGGTLTLAGPLLTDVGGTIEVVNEIVRMQNATLVSTGSGALVQLTNTAVEAASGLSMTNSTMQLAGPLLSVSGLAESESDSAAVGPIFALDASTLTSTGTGPLIQFTSTGVDNEENFLRLVNGSKITLRGSLLKFSDVVADFSDVSRSFIAVVDGSSIVTSNTNEPLLSFVGSSPSASKVTAARFFFVASFNSTTTSPSMTLSGPFLSATKTALKSGNPASDTFTFLAIRDGAQVISTSTSPFMTFTTSSLDTAGT